MIGLSLFMECALIVFLGILKFKSFKRFTDFFFFDTWDVLALLSCGILRGATGWDRCHEILRGQLGGTVAMGFLGGGQPGGTVAMRFLGNSVFCHVMDLLDISLRCHATLWGIVASHSLNGL